MKIKFLTVWILAGILAICLLPSILGAVAEVTPASGTNHTGSVTVNCSYVNGTDTTSPIEANISFYTNHTGSWAKRTVTGLSMSSGAVWATLSLSSLSVKGVAFNCTIGNNTLLGASGAPQNIITFDSVLPTVDLSVPDSQSWGREIEYRCIYSDTLDSAPSTTLSVTDPSGTATSLTAGGSALRVFRDTEEEGDYTFSCVSSDYTGNTETVTKTVTVSPLGRASGDTTKSGKSNNNMLWIVIAGAGLAVWYFTKK